SAFVLHPSDPTTPLLPHEKPACPFGQAGNRAKRLERYLSISSTAFSTAGNVFPSTSTKLLWTLCCRQSRIVFFDCGLTLYAETSPSLAPLGRNTSGTSWVLWLSAAIFSIDGFASGPCMKTTNVFRPLSLWESSSF